MKSDLRIEKRMFYRSEVMPSVETSEVEASLTIVWADENPIAFDIVTSTRSGVYGVNGSEYMGYQRGASLEALLHRLQRFHSLVALSHDQGFLARRAKFAFKHFEDSDFKTGLFTQYAIWPGNEQEYARSSVQLDYTPETLEEQLDRFCMWMDRGVGQTTHVTVDGKTARVFLDKKKMLRSRRPKKVAGRRK